MFVRSVLSSYSKLLAGASLALMAVALVIFAAGKRFYATEDVRANREADAVNAAEKMIHGTFQPA